MRTCSADQFFKFDLNALVEDCRTILHSEVKNRTPFNPVKAIYCAMRVGSHPKAIVEIIKYLADNWDDIDYPWKVFNRLMTIKSKFYRYNDRVYEARFMKYETINICEKLRILLDMDCDYADHERDFNDEHIKIERIFREGSEYIKFNCDILTETKKAFRIYNGNSEYWIPKSEIFCFGKISNHLWTMTIPKWLAERNLIIYDIDNLDSD